MNYLQENNMFQNDNLKQITNKKINSQNIFQNMFINSENMINDIKKLKNQEEIQLYHLYIIKNYLYGECIYGILHVQVKYFKKSKNYKNHVILIKEKIKKTLEISYASNKNSAFVLIDLRGMTSRQFSTKFVKLMIKTLDEYPDYMLKSCYIYGNRALLKILWPLIKSFVKKETKEKLILLN